MHPFVIRGLAAMLLYVLVTLAVAAAMTDRRPTTFAVYQPTFLENLRRAASISLLGLLGFAAVAAAASVFVTLAMVAVTGKLPN